MRNVIIMKPVAKRLGELLPRLHLLKVLTRLRDQLANHYERWAKRRTPSQPDDSFDYALCFGDEGANWHTFRFVVDDKQADGFLFVVSVSHRHGTLKGW